MLKNKINLEKFTIENMIVFSSLFLFMLIYLLPVNPGMPGSGLDPSWSNVINYAFVNNMSFGKDLYFTYGPLGSFRFPGYVYSEVSYYPAVVISIFIALIVATSLFFIVKETSLVGKIIGVVAIISGLINDGLFFWYLIPILFVMISLEIPNKKTSKILSFMLLAVLSFSVLVKFSHFPTAVIGIALVDGYFYYKFRRKLPVYTSLFFMFMMLFYVLSGQNILDFYSYFTGSFNTLSGYSEAMNIFSSNAMIYIFLIMLAGMYAVLLKVFFENKNLKLFLVSLIASLVLFMSFKQGFVRHDGHATAAFAGMSFVFGLLYLYYLIYIKENKGYRATIISFVLLAIISSFTINAYYRANRILIPYINEKINSGLPTKEVFKSLNRDKFILVAQLTELHEFYHKSISFYKTFGINRVAELNLQYKSSVINIKERIDLSDITGTVDIYPWDQSYLLANDLNYQPRPLFQSYSVYTPKLIENNIKFLRSEKAADNILFQIKEIDGRLPSTMEGASWLEILKRYETIGLKNNFLHMKKRENPRDLNLKNIHEDSYQFNRLIEVPFDSALVEIKFKKTLFGSMVNTLFKSPVLWIELQLTDGKTLKKRIVPQISSSGFLLNPYIDNIFDFHMYELGKEAGRQVKAFRIINEQGCCYKENFQVVFKEVDIQPKKSRKNIFLEIEELKAKENLEFINSFNLSEKIIKKLSESKPKIKIEFGLLPLTNENFKPTFGCFRIEENNGSRKVIIFDKCFLNQDLKGIEDSFVLNLHNSSSSYEFNISHQSEAWELGYWKISDLNESN